VFAASLQQPERPIHRQAALIRCVDGPPPSGSRPHLSVSGMPATGRKWPALVASTFESAGKGIGGMGAMIVLGN
jgi:hypothetical protein